MSAGMFSQWPHVTHNVEQLNSDYDPSKDGRDAATIAEANVTTSVIADGSTFAGLHTAVLDIDVPAVLVPSSTPGHSHLFIDVPMPWAVYKDVLDALAKAGIVQPGYASASIAREYTSVRLPWVRKPAPSDEGAPF